MTLDSLSFTVQMGLLYAIPAMAVLLAFRVVGFPDLTPDGSFTLGAGVSSILLLQAWPELAATCVAVGAGTLAGIVTALLHTRLRISKLLSGILVMTMLYSVSLRAMGTSNLSLRGVSTLLGSLSSRASGPLPIATITLITGIVFLGLWTFLKTGVGLRLRAVGDSESVTEHRGLRREPFYILGLGATNGLAALGGALVAQYQGFVDVSMGTGLVIICLAAVIIGETIVRPDRVGLLMAAPVLGMIIYQGVIAVALRMNLAAADLKVATAALALLFVAIDRLRVQKGAAGRQIGNRNI